MRFMIDNHTLEVISTDFVPIVPYNTTNLSIGLGQRYDVIVQAKEQTSGNFWLRAIPQESCSDNDSGRPHTHLDPALIRTLMLTFPCFCSRQHQGNS